MIYDGWVISWVSGRSSVLEYGAKRFVSKFSTFLGIVRTFNFQISTHPHNGRHRRSARAMLYSTLLYTFLYIASKRNTSPAGHQLPKPYVLIDPVPPALPPCLFSPLLLLQTHLFLAGFPPGFFSRLDGGAFLLHEVAGLAHAVLFAAAVELAYLVVDAGCGAPGAYCPVRAY